jgi:DNA invertase Pin-like site-specific DNA recombinase
MQRKVLANYIRISSEDRDLRTNALKNESNSVTNQRALLENYRDSHVDLREYDTVEFVDDGYSGVSFQRPQFEAMMRQVMAHQIHCVMVKDLSRFGREFIEVCGYIELVLPKVGTRFISVNDGFDTNDYLGTTGGLDLAIRNLMNAMYSQDISNKVKSAIETRSRHLDVSKDLGATERKLSQCRARKRELYEDHREGRLERDRLCLCSKRPTA